MTFYLMCNSYLSLYFCHDLKSQFISIFYVFCFSRREVASHPIPCPSTPQKIRPFIYSDNMLCLSCWQIIMRNHPIMCCELYLWGAISWLAHVEKFSLKFPSSPFCNLYLKLIFSILTTVVMYLLSLGTWFKDNFVHGQINAKYSDWAALMLTYCS